MSRYDTTINPFGILSTFTMCSVRCSQILLSQPILRQEETYRSKLLSTLRVAKNSTYRSRTIFVQSCFTYCVLSIVVDTTCNGLCHHECAWARGHYRCVCWEGYVLSDDHVTCLGTYPVLIPIKKTFRP